MAPGKAQKAPMLYGILPMLPLVLMVIPMLFPVYESVGLIEVTLFSFIISTLCEMIRLGSFKKASEQVQTVFKGMGNGFSMVVVQVVAALTFVSGLRVLGIIDSLTGMINRVHGGGILIVLAFCLMTLFVGSLSGSGLALFFAFVELTPSFAEAAGISAFLLIIPMQFTAHFVKSISPLTPTIVIISSMMGVAPGRLIKRTIVPSMIGIILAILIAYLLF